MATNFISDICVSLAKLVTRYEPVFVMMWSRDQVTFVLTIFVQSGFFSYQRFPRCTILKFFCHKLLMGLNDHEYLYSSLVKSTPKSDKTLNGDTLEAGQKRQLIGRNTINLMEANRKVRLHRPKIPLRHGCHFRQKVAGPIIRIVIIISLFLSSIWALKKGTSTNWGYVTITDVVEVRFLFGFYCLSTGGFAIENNESRADLIKRQKA